MRAAHGGAPARLVLWDLTPRKNKEAERQRRVEAFCREVVDSDPDPLRALTAYVRVGVDGESEAAAKQWIEDLNVEQRRLISSDGVFSVNLGLVLWTPLHVRAAPTTPNRGTDPSA